jgi:hypothetical protein
LILIDALNFAILLLCLFFLVLRVIVTVPTLKSDVWRSRQATTILHYPNVLANFLPLYFLIFFSYKFTRLLEGFVPGSEQHM